MHTISVYPCPEEDLNLGVIPILKERYQAPVGYSGHEVSPIPSIIAVAMCAVAVERHITLDRTMYRSDQAASLEERGLEIMIKGNQSYETAFGTGQKTYSAAEKGVAKKLSYWE